MNRESNMLGKLDEDIRIGACKEDGSVHIDQWHHDAACGPVEEHSL